MILLICKASIGLSIPMTMTSGQSCCSEMSLEADCSEDQEEKKGCCDTSVCDCLCCGHIFTLTKSLLLESISADIPAFNNYQFQFHYTSNTPEGIWQPPRRS